MNPSQGQPSLTPTKPVNARAHGMDTMQKANRYLSEPRTVWQPTPPVPTGNRERRTENPSSRIRWRQRHHGRSSPPTPPRHPHWRRSPHNIAPHPQAPRASSSPPCCTSPDSVSATCLQHILHAVTGTLAARVLLRVPPAGALQRVRRALRPDLTCAPIGPGPACRSLSWRPGTPTVLGDVSSHWRGMTDHCHDPPAFGNTSSDHGARYEFAIETARGCLRRDPDAVVSPAVAFP